MTVHPSTSRRSTLGRIFASGALALVLATSAVAVATPASAASPAPSLPQVSAAQAGANWLASQITSGGYIASTTTPGTANLDATANAVFALATAGVDTAQATSALEYLEAHVDDYVTVSSADGPGQLALLILDAQALGVPPTSFGGTDLVTRLLFEEDLMLVVPEGHALAGGHQPLKLEDLADLELLLPLPGTSFRDELDARTRPLGITLLPAAEIDGLRLIASLTFEGYGPAILPATAIPTILRDRFHPVPIAGLPRRRVGVAQRSRGLPSAPTRALIELLRTTVAQPEGRPQGLHLTD